MSAPTNKTKKRRAKVEPETETTGTNVIQIHTPQALAVAYFKERGISAAQADAAGVEIRTAEEMAVLAPGYAWGRAAIAYPFHDLDGPPARLYRYRFLGEPQNFKPTKDQKKPLKAWQEKDTKVPAYLVPGLPWREIANDPSRDLVLSEGEAKAIAACGVGITTIAVTGTDNFHVGGNKERLVPGLEEIVWKGRNVAIAYDSDAATNKNVLRAEGELRAALEARGAHVQIVRLPPGPNGEKQGLDDYLAAQGADALRKLLDDTDRLPDALDSGAYLLDTEFPPVTYAIEPYLPHRELTEIHGAHGQGKSTLMLYAALSVATGEKWHERKTTQGRAVFISLEDKTATLALRTRAWLHGGAKYAEEPGRDVKKLAKGIRENFRCLGREKAAALVLTNTEYGQTYVRRAVVDRLVKLCAGASLVVLETATRLHPGGETNEALAVLAGALEQIATKTGACVVVVRHVTKEQARNGQIDSYGGRGGGSFADAARSVLSVAREGEKPDAPVRLAHTKSTHSARGPELLWRFEAAGGSVFLRAMTDKERAAAKAADVLDRIRLAGPEGITRRELTNKLPKKGREEARAKIDAALERLVKDGLIEAVDADGKPGPKAAVYRTVGATRAAAPEKADA